MDHLLNCIHDQESPESSLLLQCVEKKKKNAPGVVNNPDALFLVAAG